MGHIVRQARIGAPRQQVYAYVVDPQHAPNYISSITRVIDSTAGPPATGQSWRAETNFLGGRHLIRLVLAEAVPGEIVRFILDGDPPGEVSMVMAASNVPGETSLSLRLDVPSVPAILLEAMMGGLLTEDVGQLKRIMEASRESPRRG